ncbi:MAG: UPF0236 family transposase-like protein [Candidatus Coprovivens sp.]
MKIIPLINEFTNTFNEIFNKNLTPLNLESKIRDVGDIFTLKLYESFLNYIDDKFKNSKERKLIYNIKETRKRTLITSIGYITINSTSYVNKTTKERFVLLREILHLKPYQRLTNEAEYQLIKYAMDENMSQAARHALRNTIISRSTVSKKIKVLDGTIEENITRTNNQPDILYIEMDEIHANLQHGGNKICPCAIVHEGYEENFVKRKKLKNIHYFASAKLTYEELWEVIFDYVDKKYDINKFKMLFVSGDGAPGIKNYTNCFPKAKFVLDPYHYIKKHLKYIFKDEVELRHIADNYIRNDLIDDFKILVDCQIEKYPDQEKQMKEHMNYIINNLDGIKNQNHPDYKCHCSMEGHINQGFARYITSSPYGFSEQGLENKLKLLVYHANKHELTIEDYYNLKYGSNSYEDINIKINKLTKIKYDQKLSSNQRLEYKINSELPILDTPKENNRLKELTLIRQEIYII